MQAISDTVRAMSALVFVARDKRLRALGILAGIVQIYQHYRVVGGPISWSKSGGSRS
jgi:hypothetical protein